MEIATVLRMELPRAAALVVIDLQRAIDDPRWAAVGPRNNPRAEANIARLLAAWRSTGKAVFHVRHDSSDPSSSYSPGQPAHAFKSEGQPLPGEPVIVKTTPDAFVGTALEARLREAGAGTVVIAGVITNNSVEATARTAGNLGFQTFVVDDAVFTFAKRDFRGRLWSAEEVHDMSLANLAGEYATITTTAEVLASIP